MDLPEAAALKQWYEAGGASEPTVAAGAGLASANKGARTESALASLKDLQPEVCGVMRGSPRGHHDGGHQGVMRGSPRGHEGVTK
eukprot:34395-Prorocentrum_minimum.AAC.1